MTDLTVSRRTPAEYIRGAAYGLAAVGIWSGWIVVARLGLRTSLTPWDIAALRFSVAGLLLLPYVLSKGLAVERLGWIGLVAIVFGGGAPVLLANAGLLFAPAAHAGALFPGVMPLAVAILAAPILHEPFTDAKKIGFVLILLGVFCVASGTGAAIGSAQTLGHAMRRARLDGLHAAGIAAVGALILYVPAYLFTGVASLANAQWGDIALQALVQGVLTAIVSLVLYGRAVHILGASSGAAFAALSPAMTAIMAIPILGEWPTTADWFAIASISAGVYVVAGGPLPQRRI
jgi:drug/metabolite transporter (DMT)-like permease